MEGARTGTRESAHPIHRISGACELASRLKKLGSCFSIVARHSLQAPPLANRNVALVQDEGLGQFSGSCRHERHCDREDHSGEQAVLSKVKCSYKCHKGQPASASARVQNRAVLVLRQQRRKAASPGLPMVTVARRGAALHAGLPHIKSRELGSTFMIVSQVQVCSRCPGT